MEKIAQRFVLAPLQDALQLLHRAREGPFHAYLSDRVPLLFAMALLMTLTSAGCAAGVLLFLGSTRSVLDLLVFLLVPFVLVCSFVVQAVLVLSWLENRALAQALHHKARLPRLPWLYAALFLVLPLIMLVQVVA
jgi:hypothetical protein